MRTIITFKEERILRLQGQMVKLANEQLALFQELDNQRYLAHSDPILTYDYNGEVNGQTPVFNGSLEREVGESRGLYAISQGSLLLTDKDSFIASNYELAFTSGIDFYNYK